MASPAYGTNTTAGNAAGTSLTLNKPASTVDNDILLVIITLENADTITAPAGWTKLPAVSGVQPNGAGTDYQFNVWWKRAASEGASWTWTWTNSNNRSGTCVRFTGALTTGDAWEVVQGLTISTAGATSQVLPTVTTVTAETLLVYLQTDTGAAATIAIATERVDFNRVYVATEPLSTATTSTARTITNGSSQFYSVATLALRSVAPTLSGYTTVVAATSGIASYWRLGEPSGTTATDSIGSLTGTYVGSPTLAAASLLPSDSNTAVTFDGSNDTVTTAAGTHNYTGTASFSVELLVKLNSVAGGTFGYLVDKQHATPSRGGWSVSQNVAAIGLEIYSGGAFGSGVYISGLVAATTYHIVFTADASNLRSYLNGALMSTQSRSSIPSVTQNLSLGAATTAFSYFTGTLDEVAIYSSTLSAATIASHATEAVAPASSVSVNLTSVPASGTASAVAPTVVLGSVSVDLAALPASATSSAVAPSVVIAGGGTSVTLSGLPASATAGASDPTVRLGSLSLAPAVAGATAAALAPSVILGSLTVTPAAASATGAAVEPTVRLGSLSIALTLVPATATATATSPTVDAGTGVSVNLGAAPALATAAALAPSVILGSISVAPEAAGALTSAIAPSVVQSSLTVALSALPATATASAVAPTVVTAFAIVLPVRSTSVIATTPASFSDLVVVASASVVAEAPTSHAARAGAPTSSSSHTRPYSTATLV
jgi:hypothetical protein